MKKLGVAVAVTAVVVSLFGSPGVWAAKTGDKAPAFSATDTNGKKEALDQFKGKYVVLEWTNEGCPYVKKHYESGNMQKLQKEWTDKGVVWLTILSSAHGKQGALNATEANQYFAKEKAGNTAVILDPKGEIARSYSAKTTPHMFVIDPNGTLIYNGALDDKATTEKADVNGAKNYVSAALTEAMAGKAVTVASTRPYGCSVKY